MKCTGITTIAYDRVNEIKLSGMNLFINSVWIIEGAKSKAVK